MVQTNNIENNHSKAQVIGTTTTVISNEVQPKNGSRVLFRYTNSSAGGQVITLGVDADAVSGSGITLQPGGFHMEAYDGGLFNPVTQKRLTAVSNVAGAILSAYERVVQ